MAETSQLDRVRSFARAVAADAGVRPRTGARIIRQLFGSLNIWFWAIVGLPTLVAGVYYFAIASDLYLSEAKFIVRSPKQVQTSTIGALIQSTGLARAVDDTAVVEDFIMSRDAVGKLEQQDHLREVFGRPEGDVVTRFPGILMRSDFEALFQRYAHFVSVETDHSSGVTALRVKAYLAEDAQNIAKALLGYSEGLSTSSMIGRARTRSAPLVKRSTEPRSEFPAFRASSRPTVCNRT